MIKTLPKQKLGYWPVGTQIGWLSSTGPTSTMRTLLGLPSVGQGLCGGTCSEEHAWGEQGGHQGTQAHNAGQVGLNMALAVMKKTPTLLMNYEAGSGTRLGLPIAWKFPE